MSTRQVRVTVRGAFDGLDADQRAALLAQADDHDVLRAAYTPQGQLTYDLSARPNFTFRILQPAEDEAGMAAAAARAEAATQAWMIERGYAWKALTSRVDDPAQAPLGARGRRIAARNDARGA